MYGKWLYKEIGTEYGACMVEIYRKNYTGGSIEIGALAADSLSIALENLGSITDPIGKSVCSFSIIDTNQVEYDDFFTPDATALKVVVSTRVGGGAYVTRWSGYVTPDFFAENLSYRTPISISARDNIGYLNDVDFDLTATTITVRELIQSAFNRIAEDYPMSLSFVTQKQTAEGILAIDATISTTLLKEMTWGEALETILHDLGLQMRWVDNNTIAVLDLSQIPEYYAIQGFNFVDASGYREIVPAWRQLAQEQSYGVRENFYEGQIDQEAKLEYVTTSQISTNILLYQPIALTQWRREGAIYLLNFFNGYNFDVDDNKAESIYITGVGSNATITDVLATKMVYSQRVTQVDKQMKFTFNLNDTLREPRATSYNRGEADSIFYLPYSQQSGLTTAPIPRPYQLKFRFNVFLRAEDGSEYVMREEWVNANTTITEQPFIEFKTKKLEVYNSGVNDAQGNPRVRYTSYDNEEEFSITIGSIPKAGILEFVVYPYTFVDDEYASVRDDATFQRGAKISDITFAIKDTATGIESNTLVDAQHNVKNAVSYSFGEVPIKNGDFLLYAGGLFNPVNLTALKGYQRNADATNYNLLELVGRELIHFNKRNYNRLSGTIKNLNKEPLMFNRLFVREGKKYAPYNYSLNVISNEMNITSMQEVEPYETATFNTIDSQITTGGGTVSGGNNTILQYSEETGNEKRLFELQTATEQEKSDAYVLVDKAGFPEARKVHVSELGGIDVRALEQYLEKNGYTALKTYWTFNEQDDTLRTTHNIVVEGGGAFGMGAESGDVPSASVSIKFEGSTIVYSPVDGIITLPAYPSGGGGVADSVAWSNVTNKPTTLSGYGITDAYTTTSIDSKLSGYLPLSGGTINNGTTDTPLYLKGSASGSYLGYVRADGTVLGYFGFDSNKTPQVVIGGGNLKTLLHSDNYSSYALPLSGGTMANNAGIKWSSNVHSWDAPVKGFECISTTNDTLGYYAGLSYKGYYGLQIRAYGGNTDSIQVRGFNSANWGTWRTIIHSGNIGSQSVNYANSANNANYIGGVDIDRIIYGDNPSKTKHTSYEWNSYYPSGFYVNKGCFTIHQSYNEGNVAGITLMCYDGTNEPLYLLTQNGGGGGSFIQLARVTDNVASATKLQTARTIWGQSFDGSANVSGIAYFPNGDLIYAKDEGGTYRYVMGLTSVLSLGYGSASAGIDTYILGKNIHFRYYDTDYKYAMSITSSGNVLMGTTDDNGAKLQVNGAIDTTAEVKIGGLDVLRRRDTKFCVGEETTVYASQPTSIYGTSISFLTSYADERMRVADNGNVLIGATGDNGAKLQVDGGSMRNPLYLNTNHSNGPIVFISHNNEIKSWWGYAPSLQGVYLFNKNDKGLFISDNDNALIGTTSDTGDKLRVYGSLRTDGVITGTSAIKMSWSGASSCGLYPNDWITSDGVNSRLWLFNDNQLALYGSEIQLRNNTSIYGDLTVTGGGAFGSDIRYKDIIAYQKIDLETIVNAPLFTFKWTDREDKVEHLGTSAQYWLGTQFKDAVNITNPKFYHLDYGALGVGIGISVAREVKVVKTEVELLRDEVRQLRKKLKEYETYGTIRI